MTSKEIIRRVLDFQDPPRIGYHFNEPNPSDIMLADSPFDNLAETAYRDWGRWPQLLEKTPWFNGEVRRWFGNTYGRLNEITKGESIWGALEDGWHLYDAYEKEYLAPYLDPDTYPVAQLAQWAAERADKFTVSPVMALQAIARDARKMDNMLADTLMEQENLQRLINACADIALVQADILHKCGFDAAAVYDDWGLQGSLFINPRSWRRLWKDAYARVIDRLHGHGMKFLLHSCGYILDIVDDLVEIGVDAFQFDQPALYDFADLSGRIGGKAALWAPVDIQKILPTGDKDTIEAEARRMIQTFHRGGGLIAKDYPTYNDIGVPDEWAGWARDVFME